MIWVQRSCQLLSWYSFGGRWIYDYETLMEWCWQWIPRYWEDIGGMLLTVDTEVLRGNWWYVIGSLYIVYIVAQVIRRLLTAKSWDQFLASLCEIWGGQSVIGTGLYPSTSLSSVSIILPRLRTYFNLQGELTRRTWKQGLGMFPVIIDLSKTGELGWNFRLRSLKHCIGG